MSRLWKMVGLVVVVAMILARPEIGLAQQASVVGTVADESKAVLPGVTVTATQVDTGRQFMDLSKDHLSQVLILGITFMVIAGLTDGLYALAAGRVRSLFSAKRTRLVSRVSGSFMIGGGLWLAFTRSR